ncbi:hypothetical protein JTE90_020589 [Oedothorax gibbosus]|uniref:Uncharacterized protein n=1 Tax=Oedothorax gibbosus TaxID=931172 RepID=A0AAV6VZH0_9ARAC|nr:hypothetical protein JTE90_020589 [Oedothorax gibbosus]
MIFTCTSDLYGNSMTANRNHNKSSQVLVLRAVPKWVRRVANAAFLRTQVPKSAKPISLRNSRLRSQERGRALIGSFGSRGPADLTRAGSWNGIFFFLRSCRSGVALGFGGSGEWRRGMYHEWMFL